ncbi:MAG: Si-specific NAD(P)(+) transhydrogenase [Melioribacteraceae bacterium]|nr:Si-specific NAD(P)(+) transhydrogenase [Melioribacteraceae bacterium]
MNYDYDLIVIGTGPGGEGAAMKAVKSGKKVAVCDEYLLIGGSCTHRGTIPSKALRHTSEVIIDSGSSGTTNYQTILKSVAKVVDQQVKLRRNFYDRNNVDILDGRARFIDKNTIEIKMSSGGKKKFTSEYFVIATGSRPYHPPDIDFSHPRILDSDSVLDINDNPQSIMIYGAGVIGCEYASIFRGLQIKVNLINTRDKLLSFLDYEIIDALGYHLRTNGVVIRNNEEYEKVVPDEKGVTIYLKSNKIIRCDYLFWAQGRTGNSDNMDIEQLGIETDLRGSIKINKSHQTVVENIYAVGDVVGYPNLASASYDQGRFAATHIVDKNSDYKLVEHIPTGIYTLPEISSVGLTERELTTQKVPYEVGYSYFNHLARAQITGRTTGMLKIIFHRETFEILGVHCFGYGASEIIHIGQAVMSHKDEGNSLNYFINTTFNYPTMAEAYRVAALNGLNRIAELNPSV